MRCEKCGYETHPGDQICINCKAKLSLAHSYVPGIDKIVEIETVVEKKKNIRFAIFCAIGVFFLMLLVILLICFFRRV